VLAAEVGYLPGTIWIIVGVIFAGAVQDMVTLFFSMRRDGRSLGQMARDEIGPVGGAAALVAVFSIMIILLAVLALVVVNALFCLIIYGFAASVLPVWMLLAPRDYLSTFMKIGTIVLLAVGVVVTGPVLNTEAFTDFAFSGNGPVFAGSLFPFVFTTIACGALALIAASVIGPGPYFTVNAPAGVLGTTVESASAAVNQLGFAITPEALAAAAAAVPESTLVARTGGAPTLAVGRSEIFSGVFGGDALRAFWYHFAIMFEALFILTTVDAGTRVGRYMLQDTLGNGYKPMRDVNRKPGLWGCSAVVVGAWGYFPYVGVTDPLGGINQLFPARRAS